MDHYEREAYLYVFSTYELENFGSYNTGDAEGL